MSKLQRLRVAFGILAAVLVTASTGLASTPSSTPLKGVIIQKLDPRAITDVTVEVTYDIAGQQYYDYENIGTWNQDYNLVIQQTAGTFNGTEFVGNFLATQGSSACSSPCRINITQTDSRTITNLRIDFWMIAAGYVHHDYEYTELPAAGTPTYGEASDDFVTLDMNATIPGLTFDGSEWVGNFLYTPAQISSFYFALGNFEVPYEEDIWGAGFTPNSGVTIYYNSPNFGAEFIGNALTDATGIAHDTQNLLQCTDLKMKLAETESPQTITMIDTTGKSGTVITNLVRACSYAQ